VEAERLDVTMHLEEGIPGAHHHILEEEGDGEDAQDPLDTPHGLCRWYYYLYAQHGGNHHLMG
jgi:hypothetical protein